MSTVQRLAARSGNRDNDYFQPVCDACGWKGASYSNRTVEGRNLAERDAAAHRCRCAICESGHVSEGDVQADIRAHQRHVGQGGAS